MTVARIGLKCPEIPKLDNYATSATGDFWTHFPHRDLPDKAETRVNVSELDKKLFLNGSFLKPSEIARANKVKNFLLNGADLFQKDALPSCFVQNNMSTFVHGQSITDSVAHWIKKGFVSGPFDTPPLPKFRVNALLAVPQENKVRPVVNVSLPEGLSLNENIIEEKMEKVFMSTAKDFSHSLYDSGLNSLMSKFDMIDAYKNVPIPLSDLRLQGFQWLGKFFTENRLIFGARTSVSGFDMLGNTVLAIVKSECLLPSQFIHRTLDDVPIVSPAHTDWCEDFSDRYVQCCKDLNIGLAPNCEKFEKAFMCSTYGKVLGIFFDTSTLSWSLPADKIIKCKNCIYKVLSSEKVDLRLMQELMGRLNNIGTMCVFLKGFKQPLNSFLGQLQSGSVHVKTLPAQAKRDLLIWSGFLNDENKWLPICPKPCAPPLSAKIFVSDAAGMSAHYDCKEKVGAGSVGFNQSGEFIFAHQILWPSHSLKILKDSKGSRFGNKTTTLEFLGMILPFLLIPKQLKNQYIVIKVDNIGCYFGWINRYVSGDVCASILIRALHVISSYLACYVHVAHLPRVSSWEASLVDRLSRERTTTREDKKLLNSFEAMEVPLCLQEWMKSPTEDWMLPERLLRHVISIADGQGL